MTLNGVMTVILRYFAEFVYDVFVKQLPQFPNLLLILYDHINAICARNYSAIIWAKQTLITRFDRRRCIDD